MKIRARRAKMNLISGTKKKPHHIQKQYIFNQTCKNTPSIETRTEGEGHYLKENNQLKTHCSRTQYKTKIMADMERTI